MLNDLMRENKSFADNFAIRVMTPNHPDCWHFQNKSLVKPDDLKRTE